MTSVREVIKKKNDLLMRLAFSSDITEVRELMKQVRALEVEIHAIIHN